MLSHPKAVILPKILYLNSYSKQNYFKEINWANWPEKNLTIYFVWETDRKIDYCCVLFKPVTQMFFSLFENIFQWLMGLPLGRSYFGFKDDKFLWYYLNCAFCLFIFYLVN